MVNAGQPTRKEPQNHGDFAALFLAIGRLERPKNDWQYLVTTLNLRLKRTPFLGHKARQKRDAAAGLKKHTRRGGESGIADFLIGGDGLGGFDVVLACGDVVGNCYRRLGYRHNDAARATCAAKHSIFGADRRACRDRRACLERRSAVPSKRTACTTRSR